MATILGSMWESALKGQTDSNLIHKQFMTQLGNYITTNVTFNVSFTGTLISTPYTPITIMDIVKLDGSPVSLSSITFENPNGGDGLLQWMDWMKKVYKGISSALVVGPLTVPTRSVTAFPTMINPTWTRDELLLIHQSNWNNPQTAIMDGLANLIISDMTKFYITSYPAIYSTLYTGIATIISINTL